LYKKLIDYILFIKDSMKVVTGNYQERVLGTTLGTKPKPTKVLTKTTKVLQPGCILYVGTECNDGRPITESFRYKQAVAMGIPIVHQPQKEKKELFVEKYKPKTVHEIIGHKDQIKELAEFLQGFPKEKRGILITGPPGIGKTTMAHLVSQACGYAVAEYNASDTRTVKALEGLNQRRLFKEVVIMDEIDGLSERGGIGEIANLIRTSQVPIICIANERPPKLKPIINVTQEIKCSRPMKSTIAIALAKKIPIPREQIEKLCEESGNDIRSVLNTLDFDQRNPQKDPQKDPNQKDPNQKDPCQVIQKDKQYDMFSATYKLMSNKKMSFTESDDLVFTDYHMIPLMVQEAYAAASADIDELAAAAERLSFGDVISKETMTDWTLLPHLVSNTTAVTKMLTGRTPSQIFPQFLGKESKRTKHKSWCKELAHRMEIPMKKMRLDYMGSIHTILLSWMSRDKKEVVKEMTTMGLVREDLDTFHDVMMEKVEIPAKTKSALTREFTKLNGKRKVVKEDEEDELEEDMKELEI
jgi:replication factor C subunit 1